jgi:hypothetical protein
MNASRKPKKKDGTRCRLSTIKKLMKGNQITMRLSNSMQRTIRALQRDFHEAYPYLKIEVDDADLLNKEVESTQEFEKTLLPVNIEKERTVFEVEKNCKEVFGFPVHIFRKSSKVWVATSYTSHWSLEKQNREAEQISNLFPGAV